jgi:hypothetical protein
LGPQRLAWAEANALYGLSVNPAPSTRGDRPPQGRSTPLQPVTPTSEPSTHPHPPQRPAERSHPPVAKREQLESTVQIAQLIALKGEDGKTRPRKRKPKTKAAATPKVSTKDEPAPVATLPSARPTHERLSSPQRPAAPHLDRGGPSLGPAP